MAGSVESGADTRTVCIMPCDSRVGSMLSLRHPKSGNEAFYILMGENLCEMNWFKQSFGSWFLRDYVSEDGGLYIYTPVDPIFVLLPLFSSGHMSLRARKNLAKMVIAHDYPLNCAKHFFLKEFLKDLQPCFKMPSRQTIRADCIGLYEDEQADLYALLESQNSKFSFTSDLWSNKGRDRGFMALTCHFIDNNWRLRKRIISFTPLPSLHTGKNISSAIYDKWVMWNLDKKNLCLVLDNASSNDAAVKDMLDNVALRKELAVDDSIFHQRCGCHILNLIVQDGLSVMTREIENIRQTMKYIRYSQSRMEKFKLSASQAKIAFKKPK